MSILRDIPLGRGQNIGARLAVCDMFTSMCDVLPLVDDCELFGISGSAILTKADCSSSGRRSPLSSYSTFFKVLIVGYDMSGYCMYTFSSTGLRWSILPRTCFHLEEHISVDGDGAVCRGKVHWQA
jgi:hypothetical protein